MNILFLFIMLTSVGILLFKDFGIILPTMLRGIENSLALSVKLFGIYAIWLSVLSILVATKWDLKLSRLISPITKKLFKSESSENLNVINLNLAANFLGMGGVCTPMGIKATENMKSLKSRVMLIVINSTSIQLIPTTIIALRSGLGATKDIFLPALIVTAITTIVGIILVSLTKDVQL